MTRTRRRKARGAEPAQERPKPAPRHITPALAARSSAALLEVTTAYARLSPTQRRELAADFHTMLTSSRWQ